MPDRLRSAVAPRVLRSLARLTPWVESELLGLRQLVGPGDVCIDVGAAAGFYTAELSRLVGDSGVVHSVEPLEFLYPVARRLGLRRGGNVRHHAVALGETVGECTLSVPLRRGHPVPGRSFLTHGSTGVGSNAEFAAHMTVPVTAETLTGFVQRLDLPRLDFIKADVEGAEFALMRGGAQVLSAFRPRLMLEIEQRHMTRFDSRPEAVVTWLAECGYRLFTWRQGGWHEAERVSDAHRNYLCSVDAPPA